jgi:hypothetical protein
MSNEQVLSVWIGGAPHGLATVQVVARSATGERLVTRERGEESSMRTLVHDLAAEHDLVPIWEDASWMDDGSRRPPAPFYTTRDLAPPSHMALAS